MGTLSFLRSLYNPGTLDTRFTTASTVPYRAIVEARNDPVASKDYTATVKASAKPSKWRTAEYRFYSVAFSLTIPYILWVAFQVSRRMWRIPAGGVLGPR